MPVGIGPPGTKIVGKWPNLSAPISRPGTILSQIPKHITASNMLCDSPMAVDMAITSLLSSESSIPCCP